MTLRKILIGISSLCFCWVLQGQDIHYSQYQMSPLGLNPALAGSFSGTARVGGIYRMQDVIAGSESVSAGIGYKTYSFFLDAPIIRGIRESHWVGLGLGLTSDVAGIGNLRETATIQALSYHIPLDKKNQNVISFGVNSGSLSYRGSNLYDFEDELISGGNTSLDDQFFTTQGGGGQKNRNSTIDWGAGLTYKGILDNVSALRLGFSAAHLNNPSKRLSMGQGGERLPLRITAFAEYDRLIGPRTRVIPSLLFQNYRTNNEVAMQTLFAYYLNPEKEITVYGGAGLRINTLNPIDALPIYLGFDIGDVKARLAYDMTLSRKAYTNRGFGALEFGVNYIFKIYKKPKVDPAIFCPRF